MKNCGRVCSGTIFFRGTTNKYLPLREETRVIGIYSNVHFPSVLRLLFLILPKLRFLAEAAWARTKARAAR